MQASSAANPKFASYRGGYGCELRVQKRHWNHSVSSVLFDSEVRSEIAANACELRNRDTSQPFGAYMPNDTCALTIFQPSALRIQVWLCRPIRSEPAGMYSVLATPKLSPNVTIRVLRRVRRWSTAPRLRRNSAISAWLYNSSCARVP